MTAYGGAARRGETTQVWTQAGRFAQKTTVLLARQSTEHNCPECFSKTRTNEMLFKLTEEHKERLTRIYPRFKCETTAALHSGLLTSVPTPIDLCKPLSYKACPIKNLSSNQLYMSTHTLPTAHYKKVSHIYIMPNTSKQACILAPTQYTPTRSKTICSDMYLVRKKISMQYCFAKRMRLRMCLTSNKCIYACRLRRQNVFDMYVVS